MMRRYLILVMLCHVAVAGEVITWQDGAPDALESRRAVVVVADSYVEKSWNIANGANNGDWLTRTLVDSCGFAKEAVARFSGDRVASESISAAIRQVGQQARSRKTLLVVYWTGHGWVRNDGSPELFVYGTVRDGGSFANTVQLSQLHTWIEDARRDAAASGSELVPVVVVDACRTRTMAPPPNANRLRSDVIWQVFGTADGAFAAAPEGREPSPFTRAWCESLAGASSEGRDAHFVPIFEEAERRTRLATANAQQPVLVRGQIEPLLVRSRTVVFTARVVDTLSDLAIDGAQVALDQGAMSAAGTPIDAQPGQHTLVVAAAGHETAVLPVNVLRSSHGATATVRLLPHRLRLTGRVVPPVACIVEALGFDGVRTGFHQMQTASEADGRFTLLVPAPGNASDLRLSRLGSALARYPVRIGAQVRGADGVPQVDLGSLPLPIETAQGDPLAGASANLTKAFTIGMPAAVGRNVVPTLPDAFDQGEWSTAMRLVATQPAIALDKLRNLRQRLQGANAAAVAGAVTRILLEQHADADSATLRLAALAEAGDIERVSLLRVALGKDLEAAAALSQDGRLDHVALHALLAREGSCLDDATWPGVRRRIGSIIARQMSVQLGAAKWDEARALAEACFDMTTPDGTERKRKTAAEPHHQPKPWVDAELATALTAAMPQVLLGQLAPLSDAAIESGRWDDYDAFLAAIRAAGWEALLSEGDLGGCLLRANRERISPETRANYREAVALLAAGGREAAFDRFTIALVGANGHYAAIIRRQLAALGPDLAAAYARAGLERELEGQHLEAMICYTSAARYDQRSVSDVRRLLASSKDPQVANVAWASLIGRDRIGLFADLTVGKASLRFRWCPPGKVTDGVNANVTIPVGFWLSDSEITQEFYAAVVSRPGAPGSGKTPVMLESASDWTSRFFVPLSNRPALPPVRPPSSLEWKYACLAGQDATPPDIDVMAWWAGNSAGEVHPVKTKQPNAWGFYDMLGNAIEVTSDGPLRGGSCRSFAADITASSTAPVEALWRNLIGCRIAIPGVQP